MSKYKYYPEQIENLTLDNGLKVVLVKTNKNQICARYGVNYGSDYLGTIDDINIPLGSAHFIEHRLFDMNGIDVMNEFKKYGADCNAFTSYNKTVYEFNTTKNFKQCLNLLLDFTQQINFSDKNFENEKDIIINELHEYNDDPVFEAKRLVKENTYKYSPHKIEIGGDDESVRYTTKDQLYKIHSYFYKPSNAKLAIVGNIDIDETINIIKENQSNKIFNNNSIYKPYIYDEPNKVVKEYDEIKLNVGSDMLFYSFKLLFKNKTQDQLNKLSYISNLYSLLLFDNISDFYIKNNDIIISNSLSFYIDIDPLIQEGHLGSYTNDFDKLLKEINYTINNYNKYITEERFIAYKNHLLTGLYCISDDTINLADTLIDNMLDGNNFFNDIDVILSIDYQDILDFANIIKDCSKSVLRVINI